ncbi:hypothetical protein KY366_00430 [Candidatus Woesearchaeota archaeon]|nr:hypothetical protein [Candidatus Woesearchaeota archaeon]
MKDANAVDYLLYKLFFPKTVTIDKPGIIYNFVDRKFGSKKSRKRIIWYFEDVIVSLQLETIKALGKEKSAELWYRIGKDSALRYVLLSSPKKAPSFLVPKILQYTFMVFRSAGMSFAENIEYESKNLSLTATGCNNVICRKSGDASVFAGLMSGIASSLVGKNLEASADCISCPSSCKIRLNRSIRKKHLPDLEDLRPSKRYEKVNFPGSMKIPPNHYSFSDLLRFKKIQVDRKQGKVSLYGLTIIPTEIGLSGILISHYLKDNKALLEASIISSAEKIAGKISSGNSPKERLHAALKMLSALGWGFIHLKEEKKEVIADLLYPPINKHNSLYPVYLVNGFLNHYLGRRYAIEKTYISENPARIRAVYIKA